MKNKIFSKSFTIFVFVISLSILIRFEHSWTIFNSQYNKDLENIQNIRKSEQNWTQKLRKQNSYLFFETPCSLCNMPTQPVQRATQPVQRIPHSLCNGPHSLCNIGKVSILGGQKFNCLTSKLGLSKTDLELFQIVANHMGPSFIAKLSPNSNKQEQQEQIINFDNHPIFKIYIQLLLNRLCGVKANNNAKPAQLS